jgi:Xaa-Pro aminopeptidase
VDVQSLDATAREALKKFGFDKEFCHALGHGVGLDIHEGVSLSSRAKKGTRLKKGEVITIEPGVYIAGKFGMRIEDTVVVK